MKHRTACGRNARTSQPFLIAMRAQHSKRIAVVSASYGFHFVRSHRRYYCRQMNKAELHVHLEGSIEPEALLEIEPGLTREEIAANTAFDTFDGFIESVSSG